MMIRIGSVINGYAIIVCLEAFQWVVRWTFIPPTPPFIKLMHVILLYIHINVVSFPIIQLLQIYITNKYNRLIIITYDTFTTPKKQPTYIA